MPPVHLRRSVSFSARKVNRVLYFTCSLFVIGCGAIGCGAPGQPIPPSPPVTEPVADLAAHQAGEGVLLTFTLPGRALGGQRLTVSPGCEIFRGALKADGAPDAKSFRMVYAVPGALVKDYLVDKRVEFLDPLGAEELQAHAGGKIAYLVRTRISEKRASADSNVVTVAIFSVPERITRLDARVTENAIELNWPPPTRMVGGGLPPDFSYHVYRGQLEPTTDAAGVDAAPKDLLHAKWKSKLALLATPASNSYRDADFEFDQQYVYVVRTAVASAGGIVESADSVAAIVTPKDTFPPAAPQGVSTAVLDQNGTAAPVVDLSWSISPENDVAGYRVYRSEQESIRGSALQPNLLLTPAVRDTSALPGHRYWYTVTAVDRAGNESAGSAPVMVEISAQPSS